VQSDWTVGNIRADAVPPRRDGTGEIDVDEKKTPFDACVHSAERAEQEQADDVDTDVDRRSVCAQLVAVDGVHVARRVPAAADQVNGRAIQGVRVLAHDGHVDHVHQPAAVRLAEHQLPAGHIGHMPADVVLRRPEAAAQTQAVPVGGHGLSRAQRQAARRTRVRGAVPAAPPRRRDHRTVDRGEERPAVQHQLLDHPNYGHVQVTTRLQHGSRRKRVNGP